MKNNLKILFVSKGGQGMIWLSKKFADIVSRNIKVRLIVKKGVAQKNGHTFAILDTRIDRYPNFELKSCNFIISFSYNDAIDCISYLRDDGKIIILNGSDCDFNDDKNVINLKIQRTNNSINKIALEELLKYFKVNRDNML